MQADGGRANANHAVVVAAANVLLYANKVVARGDSAAVAGANVFEPVFAQLIDSDLEAYHILLLNVPFFGKEFDKDVYLSDILAQIYPISVTLF